jgi:hypothetical protein
VKRTHADQVDMPPAIQSSIVELKGILCTESLSHCHLLDLLAATIEAYGVPVDESRHPVAQWQRVRGSTHFGHDLSP